MKLFAGIFFSTFLLLISVSTAFAQSNSDLDYSLDSKTNVIYETEGDVIGYPPEGYKITNFFSDITINQDASITVKETIMANFLVPKHGIFRYIPRVNSARGKTIRTDIKVLSVTNESGQAHQYELTRRSKDIFLKIGDPDNTITGGQIYIIEYTVFDMLQTYEDTELYWNAAGSGWDVPIQNPQITVTSNFAPITKSICYTGPLGSSYSNCTIDTKNRNFVYIVSQEPVYPGSDFTFGVALDKNNQLQFPGPVQQLIKQIINNIGYPISLIPLSVMIFIWLKFGRDRRFFTDNIYYKPDDEEKTAVVPMFGRKFIPTVYSPIEGLTPSEVGTLIDERVDLSDVVAEILELSRLGHIKIKRVEGKRSKKDYAIVDLKKDQKNLKEHQSYLLKELFRADITTSTIDKAHKFFDKDSAELQDAEKLMINGEYVLLDAMKDKFYIALKALKEMLYKNLTQEKLFRYNPENTRVGWIIGYIIFSGLVVFIQGMMIIFTDNPFPIFLTIIISLIGVIFAFSMPRRTAWGYSLYRQAEGLKYYIKKGEWRHKIAEKHLFIEEILPLAVSLGVVKELTKDMEQLGIQPPKYVQGFTTGNFYSSMSSFQTSAVSSVSSIPGSRGGTWSGGSGFGGGGGGGGSGGGGGGGGGGGW